MLDMAWILERLNEEGLFGLWPGSDSAGCIGKGTAIVMGRAACPAIYDNDVTSCFLFLFSNSLLFTCCVSGWTELDWIDSFQVYFVLLLLWSNPKLYIDGQEIQPIRIRSWWPLIPIFAFLLLFLPLDREGSINVVLSFDTPNANATNFTTIQPFPFPETQFRNPI